MKKKFDYNETTLERNSSLRNTNRAITTRLADENSAFYGAYNGQNPATEESPTRKNYRTYPYDYFSGIDAKVFFGDVWVDDIVTIQYSVNQSKVPIYGYASQLYDAIARGTVIVQGTLTIAFKEMGYLNMVQKMVETQAQGAQEFLRAKAADYRIKAKDKMLQFIPNIEGSSTNVQGSLDQLRFAANGNAQIIRQQETIEQILQYKKDGNVVSKGLSVKLLDEKAPDGKRDFEDFAELMEDTIWGDSNGSALRRNLQFLRADEFDYTRANGRDSGGIKIGRTLNNIEDYSDVLNIMITFGDMNDFRAEHTITVLNDVHFTSQNVLVSPTGDPIGETYTFFARNINQTLSSETMNIPPIKFSVGTDIDISRLQDVEALQDYLTKQKSKSSIDIFRVASFKEGSAWDIVENDLRTVSLVDDVYFNSYEPFIDQLIRLIERQVNDPASAIDTDYSQHILEVTINFEGDVLDDNFKDGNVTVMDGSLGGRVTQTGPTNIRSGTMIKKDPSKEGNN